MESYNLDAFVPDFFYSHTLFMRVILLLTFWKTVLYYLLKMNIKSSFDPNIELLPDYVPNLRMGLCPLKGKFKNVHSSNLHKGSKLETSKYQE
jgi:hypothetical protein